MKKYATLIFVFISTVSGFSQQNEQKPLTKDKETAATLSVSKTATPIEIAKIALAAHGGDKFKTMKTLVVRGTVDISGSPTMTFPGTFATIFSGEKYRLEIVNPIQPFKQTFDGQQTVSSIRGFELPPLNRLGLPLLARIGDKDFTVSALSEKSKKKMGFRITAPEGFYTDFFIDEKTGMIKSYEASYQVGDRTVTTSIEIDKVRDIDGVKIPERYAQRFDTGQVTFYASFKAKEILVNSAVADDVFTGSK
ncbi:MAG: hypothetical protein M3033_03055 [Acidobacteriota bacterium]|nr:hypothetical protein [Acidobacteriota bacterium]